MQTGAQVTDQAVQGILSRIDLLSAKLGIVATHLWEIYVHQAKIEGFVSLALAGFFLIIVLVSTYYLSKELRRWEAAKSEWRAYRSVEDAWYGSGKDGKPVKPLSDDDPNSGIITTTIMIGVIGIIVVLVSLGSAYTPLLNPQYWAFQHLTADLRSIL